MAGAGKTRSIYSRYAKSYEEPPNKGAEVAVEEGGTEVEGNRGRVAVGVALFAISPKQEITLT